MKTKIKNETSFLYKRNFNTDAKHAFQNELYETNWKDIETFTDPNEAYKAFLEKFLILYDKYFLKQKIKVKTKDLQSPWVTKGIKKIVKKKTAFVSEIFKK